MVDETQIDLEQELLRIQMDDTREALTEKMERLEEKVTETVESATASVAEATATVMETVQNATASVSETVGSVTDAFQGTVDSVLHSVEGTVDSVKGAFDLNHQVQRHPWLMLAGAVAVGYGVHEFFRGPSRASSALGQRNRRASVPTSTIRASSDWEGQSLAAPQEQRSNGSHLNGFAKPTEATDARSPDTWGWLTLLSEKLAPELGKLEELVLGTALGSLRDILTPNVPHAIQKPLAEILDTVTEKLGGKCIKGSLLTDQSEHSEASIDRALPFRIPR